MVKVSVVIPVYNSEEYLRKCLDSVLGQSLKEIEIICVNDGSSDNSISILEEYAKNNENLVVIDQPNEGPSCRNIGIEKATGKYIYFLDSDDLIPSDALERLYEVCEDKSLDLVYFSADVFYEDAKLEAARTDFQGRYIRKGEYKEVKSGKDLIVDLQNNFDYIVSACLMFTRREILISNNIRFLRDIYHEDNLFCFTCIMNVERAFCINDICYHRRVRNGSIMTKKETSTNLLGYFKCYVNQYNIGLEKDLTEEQREVVYSILNGLYYHIERIHKLLDETELEKFMQSLTEDEKHLYEVYFKGWFLLDRETNVKVGKLNNQLKTQIQELESNIAYKMVRTLTLIPRKLRTVVKILKNKGIKGIITVLASKIKK